MKIRHAWIALTGLLFVAIFISLGMVANSTPRQFRFLQGKEASRAVLERNSGGMLGGDVRYYILDGPFNQVEAAAHEELLRAGWRQLSSKPALWRRGRHSLIQITPADTYYDTSLIRSIPPPSRPQHTVVQVIDPRWRVTLKDRFESWLDPQR